MDDWEQLTRKIKSEYSAESIGMIAAGSLLSMLHDDDWPVREASLGALCKEACCDDEPVIEHFLEMLTSKGH